MEPFDKTETLRGLTERVLLDESLDFAKRIGNYKPNSAQFKQAMARTAIGYLKSRGVPEERLKELTTRAPPTAWKGMPTTGPVKIFALLIEFSDHPHNNDANTINEKLFGSPTTGQPYESLANYYKRASYNKLDLSGGITLGWYNTKKNRSAVPMTDNGRDSLIKEALQYFKAQGHNFAQYDNDNDGVIDYFMVFWTGPNTAWATFWWGYQTTFSDSSFKLDGKRLYSYSWQWEAKPVGAAFSPRVAIHETGHALGLPDLYDYDEDKGPDGGVGGADMMDANVLDHNCFSKWMMEWLEPTVIGSGTHTLTLNPSGKSGECVVIWPGLDRGDIFSEYFLVQNRQPVENDIQLPGNGLMIWHVDARLDSSGNDFQFDNSFASHKLVRLMEADSLEEIETNRGFNVGDLYTQGKSFGHGTVPSSKGYDGQQTYIEVSNIIASGSQISAEMKCEKTGKSATKAFLVGIDEYQRIGGLEGCVNDVEDVANTLVILGFDPKNVMIKTNASATKDNIMKGLKWLFEDSQPADKLVFYYAGHGSQVTDPHGDDPDGLDEVILPTDLNWSEKNYITDDELRKIFQESLKEDTCLEVILDSCFSGTGTRAVLKERYSKPPIELTFHQDHAIGFAEKGLLKLRGRDATIVPGLNHVLWAGASDKQTAKEIMKDGLPRGAFTANFCEILRRSKNDKLPRSKIDALVKSAIKRANIADQTPQLEASENEMLEEPFT